MKVVIDTNVLVSAVLKDRHPEAVLLFVAGRDDIDWIVSPEILAEYREVLSRPKFGLPADIRQGWFEMLDALTAPCDVDLEIDFPREEKTPSFSPVLSLAAQTTSLPATGTSPAHRGFSPPRFCP